MIKGEKINKTSFSFPSNKSDEKTKTFIYKFHDSSSRQRLSHTLDLDLDKLSVKVHVFYLLKIKRERRAWRWIGKFISSNGGLDLEIQASAFNLTELATSKT